MEIVEKPILFSGPMVRAILEGRKTQTRRVVKFPKIVNDTSDLRSAYPDGSGKGWVFWTAPKSDTTGKMTKSLYPEGGIPCPHPVGSRLWVRETWQGPILDEEEHESYREDGPEAFQSKERCLYRASGDSLEDLSDWEDWEPLKWRPSIFMPRWACRLKLEVTEVRVERLQEISEADAIAEGVLSYCKPDREVNPVMEFAALWRSINGPDSWQANPWVWAYTFKVVQP